MARIITAKGLERFLPKKKKGRVVLAGGCFDMLHIGHLRFLSEAKKLGDYLVVLLESDKKVRRLKGKNRPVFVQEERAEMLSELRSVDLVVLLENMKNDSDYSDLVMRIRPDIIVVTEGDPYTEMKKWQAREVGGRLKTISLKKTFSSSKLTSILGME